MTVNVRMARESIGEAIRSFSLASYGPIFVLLGAQILYLLLGLNLGSALGMATAGLASRLIAGPDSISYPGFFHLLPVTYSFVESITFVLIGAWALPVLAAGILPARSPAERKAGARRGFLPTFLALALVTLLAYFWQRIEPSTVGPLVGVIARGEFPRAVVTWTVGVIVVYALTTLVVYVPIVAVRPGTGAVEALRGGIGRGFARFWVTYPMAILFSLPALLLQLTLSLLGSFIANRTRPENVAYLLIGYAILSSLGIYLLWGAATRLHETEEDGE